MACKIGGNSYGNGVRRESWRSYSSSIKGSLVRTESIGCTRISLTTPSRVALMLCSIFMASTTQTSCPVETRSPGRTRIEMTRPESGEAMTLSGPLPAEPRVGGGGTTMPGVCVRPRRGRAGGWAGKPSTSTKNVSPSTVTWTGDWVSSPTSTLYQLSPTLIRSVVTANPYSPKSERGAARGVHRRATG